MEINDKYIKFNGKANIPDELNMGEAYEILMEGEVTSVTESNNQDGTKAVYYKFYPIRAEIRNQFGKLTKIKDTRSMAQKIRAMIKWKWECANDDPRDAEEAYSDTMKELMKFLDSAYKRAKPSEKKVDYPDSVGNPDF